MCGIVGGYALQENSKKKLDNISLAISTLSKRGPDSNGIYTHNDTALAHTRLAIIDTSSLAQQPFTDRSGDFTIVFNGEIFNYKELKKELLNKGYQFKSESDTEVLLNLYIEEQELCLNKLNGFFSFVIYNKRKNELFMARDRFGIKPFFYSISDNFFCFASEIKALLKFGLDKTINKAALMQYFHLNYIAGTHSIFNEIKKLAPGHFAKLTKKDFKIQAYYKLQLNEQSYSFNNNFETSCKTLYKLLDESVQLRMIADVPLGSFLSGGIDSSIITALASKHTNQLNTFSIGFKDEPFFDETKYAQIVAKKFHTQHTAFMLSNNELYENLHNMLEYMDEPFADSSALNVYILSMYTRKKVTVALSGDGSDEMFAGYNKHAALYKTIHSRKLTAGLKYFSPLLAALPQSRNSKITNIIRQLHKLSDGANLNDKERYWQWAGFYNYNLLRNLFHPDFMNKFSIEMYEQEKKYLLSAFDNPNQITINEILLTDIKMVLDGDMLPKVDRMSMANSLEVRSPFLDYRVVDFVFSLPSHFKINSKNRKIILKETFKNELPIEIFQRSKKGFEVPLLKWFNADLKAKITEDLLSDSYVREQQIFNPVAVKQTLQKLFSSSPGDSVAQIWALMVFQTWYKKYYIN